MNRWEYIIGVDISAKSVSYAWRTHKGELSGAYQVEQTTRGHQKLLNKLQQLHSEPDEIQVVLEATSTYWIRLSMQLHQAGYHVCVINPVQSAQFAKVLRQHHKTDAQDAQLLARLGYAVDDLPQWTPPPAIYEALYQRLQQRDQLVKMRVQVKNRTHALNQRAEVIPAVEQRNERLLAEIAAQIEALDTEIETLLTQESPWGKSAAHLQSITGIGPITAAWILTATLNFDTCHSADQASAYAGLVPHFRESGDSIHGKPRLSGGHARLRTALYQAAMSACQHNPPLRRFYQRLLERGKLKKVARCAVARKLMCLAYTLVTRGRDFDPDFGQHSPVAAA